MKRLSSLIFLGALIAAQAVWAQPRPGGQGGGGERNFQERRAERQEPRREQFDRRPPQGDRNERAERSDRGGQRMTPEERRALRDQVRDHGRDIYRDPPKR